MVSEPMKDVLLTDEEWRSEEGAKEDHERKEESNTLVTVTF
jgi:hypothetical protein